MPPVDLSTHPVLAQYSQLITECAIEYQLDESMIASVILVESSGRADAYNPASGATGLMAVMPREAGPMFADRPSIVELKSPFINLGAGCAILAGMLQRTGGDYKAALKLYSGFGNKPLADYEARYWAKIEAELAKLREGREVATTTERFIKAAEAEFGSEFQDLRANPKVKDQGRGFRWIDSRTMPYIVIHHSTGPVTTTAQTIWNHHVKTNGWPGIGYHLLIRLPPSSEKAQVQLVGSLDTQRAHVLNMNHLGLGICVAGNFDTRPDVPPPMVDALKRLIRVLDSIYDSPKTLRTHGGAPPLAMLPNYTQCPGSALKAIVPSLRTTQAPQTPPAPSGRVVEVAETWLRELTWNVQEARRENEDGDAAAVEARLRDNVEFNLVQRLETLGAE